VKVVHKKSDDSFAILMVIKLISIYYYTNSLSRNFPNFYFFDSELTVFIFSFGLNEFVFDSNEGVEKVKSDCETGKLTVKGDVDPSWLRERVEIKTKKKVDLILSPPKKVAGDKKSGGDGAAGDKKSAEKTEKKTEDKKADEKKPKEVKIKIFSFISNFFFCSW